MNSSVRLSGATHIISPGGIGQAEPVSTIGQPGDAAEFTGAYATICPEGVQAGGLELYHYPCKGEQGKHADKYQEVTGVLANGCPFL